jgi:hypothetical protein
MATARAITMAIPVTIQKMIKIFQIFRGCIAAPA